MEGKPTEITEDQILSLGRVTYEGREAQLVQHYLSAEGYSTLGLVIGEEQRLWLYGYIEDGVFVELDSEGLT